jgi:hypothetical protein
MKTVKRELNMSIVAAASGNSSFELCPAGVTVARCYRIIDLGTQTWDFKGKQKSGRKVIINWETAELDSEGRPLMVGNKYTVSLHEKAVLRKDLQAWRGRAFTEAELGGFDITKLLGAPCMLNIIHSDDGKYANISSLMPVPKGMAVPPAHNKAVIFSLSDFDQEVFDSLSDGLKNTIKQSPEYQAIAFAGDAQEATGSGKVELDDVDTIPF